MTATAGDDPSELTLHRTHLPAAGPATCGRSVTHSRHDQSNTDQMMNAVIMSALTPAMRVMVHHSTSAA